MTLGQDKGGFEKLIDAMKQNPSCGNLPVEAASAYSNASPNERGSIFTSTINSLKWISSDAMRAHLSQSDFTLTALKTRATTIYVVLDFDAMKPESQGRYMRVMLNLSLRLTYTTPLPAHYQHLKRRVLFILDEVAQLGPMPAVQDAFRSHAGAMVKLWCFFQDYEALEKNYGSPAALMGNSSKQFFGCGDPDTAKAIENYLGQYLDTRPASRGVGDGDPTYYESSKSLLDTTEIMDTIPKEYQTQLVVTSNNEKLELTREICIPSPKNAQEHQYESEPPPLNEDENNSQRIELLMAAWQIYNNKTGGKKTDSKQAIEKNFDLSETRKDFATNIKNHPEFYARLKKHSSGDWISPV